MSITNAQLSGMITEILPDGEIAKCEPVFSGPTKSEKSKYYRGVVEQFTGVISAFEEIDITKYGDKCFLPVSRKKINDGNKYFIVFQPTKVYPQQNFNYYPVVSIYDHQKFSIPFILNVGIIFPNRIVIVFDKRTLSKEEILDCIK